MKFDFPVEIRRSERKRTAEIKVINSQVIVAVPQTLSEVRIESLINKRRGWIRKKLALQSQVTPFKPKEFVTGEAFSYLGRNYRLKLTRNDSVKLKNGYFYAGDSSKGKTHVKAALTDWYQSHATHRLTQKTQRYAELLGVMPRSTTVRDFKTKWGSCSIRGDIAYNWRIIMAPHGIVDYVVAHELSHLIEHNHSAKFWSALEKTLPDYRDKKQWLKMNGQHLVW
jgi:predicted metal-dependent hydrolase